MARYSRFRRRTVTPALPVVSLTPLIDTVLVLLVIFMVTTPSKEVVVTESGERKSVHEARKPELYPVVVTVDAQGMVTIDAKSCSLDKVAQELDQRLAQLPDEYRAIILSGDAQAPQEIITRVKNMVHSRELVHGVYEIK